MTKKFIYKSCKFLFVLIVLVVGIVKLTEYVIDKKSNFKLPSQPKHLVLGHSHPACAFNDSLINNLVNLATPGESYYYTYFKSKKLIEQNSSVEIVFLEFTNKQIEAEIDRWIWGHQHITYRYPLYASFINTADRKVFIKHNFRGFIKASSLSLRQNLKRIFKNKHSYINSIGGYVDVKISKTDSIINDLIINPLPVKPFQQSEYSLHYLSKIIEYCKENNIEIYLIRSPQHDMYDGYVNEELFQSIRQNNFPDIEYLDFSRFPLSNQKYVDLGHLNYDGAKVFSNWFENLLENGLLKKENKQEFIEENYKSNKVDLGS